MSSISPIILALYNITQPKIVVNQHESSLENSIYKGIMCVVYLVASYRHKQALFLLS
jgi:hypothetical protein